MSANPSENPASEDELLRREELRLKIRELSLPWWKRPAYMASVATIAAAILGVIWGMATGFFDVARRELEVTKRELQAENRELEETRDELEERRDEQSRLFRSERDELQAKIAESEETRQELDTEITRMREERDQLTKEYEMLTKDYRALRLQGNGLLVAVGRMDEGADRGAGKYFGILNPNDPINRLQDSYGWQVGSDDFGLFKYYYLNVSHPGVASGKELAVTRLFELATLKRDRPGDWRKIIEDRFGRLLVLDFSYFQLYEDDEAAVGGVIYLEDAKTVEFYAPLSEWSTKLGELIGTE